MSDRLYSCIPQAAEMVLNLLDRGVSRKEAVRKTAKSFGKTETYIDQYAFRYLRAKGLLPKWGEVRSSPGDEPPMDAYAKRHKNFFARLKEARQGDGIGGYANVSVGSNPKGGCE